MYKVQYKQNNVLESWTTMGTYGTEQEAIANASKKKRLGAVITRVIDRSNVVIVVN
jgi:hypothetical protein